MKITKQIDDTHFEIELDEYDFEPIEDDIRIAHDYVRFYGNSGLQTKGDVKLSGPAKTCENWIKAQHEVTIDIRTFVDVVMPILEMSEFLKKEHLVDTEGKPLYTYHDKPFFYKDPETKIEMVALPNTPDKGEWYHLPYKIYKKIRG